MREYKEYKDGYIDSTGRFVKHEIESNDDFTLSGLADEVGDDQEIRELMENC
jgi:hypothetical protein